MTYLCKAWKHWLPLVGLLVFFPLVEGCRQPTPIRNSETITGQTMGTTYSVKYLPKADTPKLLQVGDLIEMELESVNVQMSTYRDDSEISRFNKSDSSDWFPVSAETAQVVDLSLEIHAMTDKHFDVTVGPLVELWGFGKSEASDSLPSDLEIKELLNSVGSDKLEVRSDPPALRKLVKKLQVDLSAVAKGHGVDRLAGVLDKLRIEDYFVEIGGEVRTKGNGHHGGAWKVGIELPDRETRQVMRVVGISNKSMATSGDYRNFRTVKGSSFSHFIDPGSGRPVQTDIASVTVLAEDCATADAIATGLIASGRENAQALVEKHDLPVLMVFRQGDQLETFESTKFLEWVVKDKSL